MAFSFTVGSRETGFAPILLCFTEFFFTGFHLVVLAFIGFYWVLLGFTYIGRVSTSNYLVLPGFT